MPELQTAQRRNSLEFNEFGSYRGSSWRVSELGPSRQARSEYAGRRRRTARI